MTQWSRRKVKDIASGKNSYGSTRNVALFSTWYNIHINSVVKNIPQVEIVYKAGN